MSVVRTAPASPAPPGDGGGLDPVERDAIALGLAAGLRRSVGRLEPAQDRRWWRIVATDDFDAWVIDWPPGTGVDLHDHDGSDASISVIRGELDETRFEDGHPVVGRLGAGSVHEVVAGTVHAVHNVGPVSATSVHVYAPPLRSMAFHDGGRREPVPVDQVPALWDPEVL